MAMSKARHHQATDPRGLGNREKGQAAVEFALTILFLMLLIVGFLELIMMMYTYTVLANSAKEGVRYAAVHGSLNGTPAGPTCPCPDIDGPPAPIGTAAGNGSGYGVVRSYAQASMHYISGTAMTVTTTYPDTTNPPANQPPNRIRVVVSYPYKPFFGLGWPTVTVRAAAEARITF
jgi:Flp pilus assembly protein TadG